MHRLFYINKLFSLFGFFYCLLIMEQAAFAQASTALKDLVDTRVQTYLADEQSFALSIGIIDGEYDYAYHYGRLSTNNLAVPNSQTHFFLGAITKVFTTSLFAILSEQKIVQPNDTITQYLPDSIVQSNPFLNRITLEHLASHTAGFPKDPYNIAFTTIDKDNPYANYQIQNAYDFLMGFKPRKLSKREARKWRKQQKKYPDKYFIHPFNYSHFGLGLLGHLLENATQKNYFQLLEEHLFEPLQLQNTRLSLNKDEQKKSAKGHYFNGKKASTLHYASLEGSEALYSNLEDLLRFVRTHLDTSKQIQTTLAKTHEAQISTNIKYVKSCYGWYLIEGTKQQPDIWTHSGRSGGFSNFIAFVKESQTAIICLSNSSYRIDELGMELLELINR